MGGSGWRMLSILIAAVMLSALFAPLVSRDGFMGPRRCELGCGLKSEIPPMPNFVSRGIYR